MAYNPVYNSPSFTEFESVTPWTDLATLNFNWTEEDLPESVRTKHVHRLHPYLGKFIPQLVEIFLRKFRPSVVCDPFCGSGTTLVEANALGIDSIGCDVSAFNCLLTKVKTDFYYLPTLEKELLDILQKTAIKFEPSLFNTAEADEYEDTDNEYLRTWFASKARRQLLCYLSLIPNYQYQDVMKIILSRAARSARLTTHFDLDFPKKPQTVPYYCYKHNRTCRPTDDALQFLHRYTLDTLKRIKGFSLIRTAAKVEIIWGDARQVRFPKFDAIITSPPYVGFIDYHEQHHYAFELLNLPRREELEIGPASKGSSMSTQKTYIEEIGKVFSNLKGSLSKDGVVVIVIHDKNNLYKELAPKIGYKLEEKLVRHVNRRTGRRAADFFEEVMIWKPT